MDKSMLYRKKNTDFDCYFIRYTFNLVLNDKIITWYTI